MKFIDRTLTQFWNRWRSEYLLELRDAHRYGVGVANGTEIAVGDIEVVHSDEKRRGFWNIAKVEETIVGKDKKVVVQSSVCLLEVNAQNFYEDLFRDFILLK